MNLRSQLVNRLKWTLAPSLLMLLGSGVQAGIWDITRQVLEKQRPLVTEMTFDQIRSNLPLLTDRKNWTDLGGRIVVAGRMDISPFSVKILDQNGVPVEGLEFFYGEVRAAQADGGIAAGAGQVHEPKVEDIEDIGSPPMSLAKRKSIPLRGVKIGLDMIPLHDSFKTPIGGLSYPEFVVRLQSRLATRLRTLGARITILRPFSPEIVAEFQPPGVALTPKIVDFYNQQGDLDWVVSTQFNADCELKPGTYSPDQPLMTSFCGGNSTLKELSSNDEAGDRQRARFVHALLTGKVKRSVDLACCISRACELSEDLGYSVSGDGTMVQKAVDFCEDERTFEGNAIPVPPTFGEYAKAVKLRNLVHYGLMAKAVVVPFPDIVWAKNKSAEMGVDAFIEGYVQAMVAGMLNFSGPR